ncbi:hypothetical protein Hypma_008309 [Hypsizygus marmoreus]|uniref:Uncharacterized protein n=1 Tax=Hypsizygus marmoreus TaxID=39966 RepID=A0A369JVY7_HYPMA|nr:hypothetical protein Hypma_008309 [Hypsizygus marmoreus]
MSSGFIFTLFPNTVAGLLTLLRRVLMYPDHSLNRTVIRLRSWPPGRSSFLVHPRSFISLCFLYLRSTYKQRRDARLDSLEYSEQQHLRLGMKFKASWVSSGSMSTPVLLVQYVA